MKQRSTVLLLVSIFLAVSVPVLADKPGKPPAGMGKFIVFLKLAPPVPPGQTPKKIVPPDIAKLGGVVLRTNDEYRVVHLPFAAVKHLRKDENVDYVQRVWMGESREEWNATEAASGSESEGASSMMRLRPDTLTETASWGPKNYSYDGSGNIKRIAELDAGGNVRTVGTDTYRYDAVSRLKEAVVNGVTESYLYDSFGNLVQKQTGNETPVILSIDPASNRISNRSYDIAGNLTTDPSTTYPYAYDSMGMLVGMKAKAGPKRMYYTADDERIGYTFGSTSSFARWMIRSFDGRPLREFRSDAPWSNFQDGEWIWTEDYVYAAGQLVGGETAGPYGVNDLYGVQPDRRRRHFHLDHLGSVRLITTDAASIALGVHNYYPFGAEQTPINQEEMNFGGNGTLRPEPLRFTGHERDFNGYWNLENTDYIDYMHARFYNPHEGRFLSVDPVLDIKEALYEPQLWNRYSYVTNNVLKFTDPDGRYRTFYKEKPMTAENLAMDENTPAVVKASVYATGGLTALGAGGLFFAGGSGGGLAAGAFRLPPIARGNFIETALAAAFGGGLPRTFPVIDRFLNGVATSVKSLDLLGKTYQNAARLTSTLTGFVDKLAQFNGARLGNANVPGAAIKQRVLEVVVQKGAANPAQMAAIQRAAAYAKEHDVALKVIMVK